MTYQFHIEQFEGPLDLLLQLIEEQKVKITNVSLASVAEQFLDYIQANENLHPEELADFLVVAAKLLLLKSRTLIPSVALPDDGIDLEKQLKLYKEYFDASKKLEALIHKGKYSFSRAGSLKVSSGERKFRPPEGIDSDALRLYFVTVLKRLEPFVTIPEETLERTMSLKDKLESIRELLREHEKIPFHTLLVDASTRTEIIVTFLALLELVKQRTIDVVQDTTFSAIEIQRRTSFDSAPLVIETYDITETTY